MIIHWNVSNIGPLYSDDKDNGIKWHSDRKLFYPEDYVISVKIIAWATPYWISCRSVLVKMIIHQQSTSKIYITILGDYEIYA